MASSSTGGRMTMVAGPSEMAPSQHPQPMKRPGHGQAGRRIKVDSNFFKLHTSNLRWVMQYSVAIEALRDARPTGSRRRERGSPAAEPEKKWTDIAPSSFVGFNRAVFSHWCTSRLPPNQRNSLAYDGRKLSYAPAEIPEQLEDRPGIREVFYEIEVNRDGPLVGRQDASEKSEKVRLKIMKVATIDINTMLMSSTSNVLEAGPALAAIDSALACGPLKEHVQVGRSFFHPDGKIDLGEGAEAWRGFYQSARMSMNGLVVNMDESRTPFWGCGGEPLTSLMQKMNIQLRTNDPAGSKRAAKLLSGVKIKATHSNIMYRVFGFSSMGPDAAQFFDEATGQKVTITQYFAQRYGITLRDHTSPCVITNPKKKTMIPLEILYVSRRQRLTKAMTPRQTSSMIRCAATKPHSRLNGAVSAVQRAKHDTDPTCRAFGLSIDRRNLTVDARVLPAPVIQFRGSAKDQPRQGVWDSRHNQPLLNPAPLNTWAVLNLTRARNDEVLGFVSELVRNARRMGMTANPKPYVYHGRDDQIVSKLRQIHRESQNPDFRVMSFPLQLVLVISFRQDTQIYNTVKLTADIELGVATQVMLAKHLQQNDMYMGNILLKINAKLGGSNCVPLPPRGMNVPFFQRRTIVLGADVTHPTGGGMRPSVAALVCSRDSTFSQFTGAIRNQPPKQELMTEMYGMFREVYDRWRSKNGNLHCESIVMFRDGVSEGQFQQVLDEELMSIRRACHDYDKNFNPYITYIVVTKRHHARFFPKGRDSDRSGNVLPGTVIDTGVVSSQYYDFYLNSHTGIQGTSRPSKYTVLVDENKIPVDALQDYIFRLTHNYVRCKRSVSIVNSAYYAHLLAFRGRAYLNDEDSETEFSGSDYSPPPTVSLHDRLGMKLFFV